MLSCSPVISRGALGQKSAEVRRHIIARSSAEVFLVQEGKYKRHPVHLWRQCAAEQYLGGSEGNFHELRACQEV